MSNTCPKCGAAWNGLQYACGSKDNLMYGGFTQSEECLNNEQAPEFEVMPTVPAVEAATQTKPHTAKKKKA